jgi:hypothetical protein
MVKECFLLSMVVNLVGRGSIPTKELGVALDLYAALQAFFTAHQELQARPLFITGEVSISNCFVHVLHGMLHGPGVMHGMLHGPGVMHGMLHGPGVMHGMLHGPDVMHGMLHGPDVLQGTLHGPDVALGVQILGSI